MKYLLEMGKKCQKANQPDKRIKPRSCDDKIHPSFVKKNLINLKFIDKACSKTFQDLNTAILHINKIHHIPHPLTNIQCKFCKKSQSSYENLKIHVDLVHNDKKGFNCEFCFKKYSTCDHSGLELYVDVKNPKIKELNQSLHRALKLGNLTNVKILISIGAQISAKDKNKLSPLRKAVDNGHLKIVEYHIDHGANINDDEDDDYNESEFPTIGPYQCEICQVITDTKVEFLAHIKAKHHGKVDEDVLYVLESDVRKEKGLNNVSLIHTAVRGGHLEIVMCLVNHGAQVEAKDNVGWTPLHHAADFGFHNIAQYLIENGAQIDAKETNRRQTPLHLAAGAGDLDLVTLLVEKGACIDVLDTNNETPFDDANRENHKEIAKYLLEKKREAENQNPKEYFSNKDPCIICLEPRNSLFVLNPCGHMSLCEACSYNLIQQDHPKCPTCRKQVRDYTKVFYQAPKE